MITVAFPSMYRILPMQVALSSFHHYGATVPRNVWSTSLHRVNPNRHCSLLQIRALNTFLPYSSFERSIQCLDNRRLGKQRVEAKQILNVISEDLPPPAAENQNLLEEPLVEKLAESVVGDNVEQIVPTSRSGTTAVKRRRGWANAPVVRMWRGYKDALVIYYNLSLEEWERRGYRNILLKPIQSSSDSAPVMPPWLGDEELHASHRSNLLRKEPEYYRQYDWTEPENLPYIWPVPLVQTSRGDKVKKRQRSEP
ncbi:hypothetical protein R1sor_010244 [Riccia sorocarpa]|uniref:Uncharacterized protein n=1 Tax=Riccia sorocarpa TaxID=122646 RepID=A0ABD3HXF8_9MARC